MFFLGIGMLGVGLNLVGFLAFLFCLETPGKKGGLRRATSLQIPDLPGAYPGVSIVKTCCGVRDNEDQLFVHFFEQQYPGPLQLIFTVPEASDPAVVLIKDFQVRYPHIDSVLVVSETRRAVYKKVDAIFDAQPYIQHPITIISDSDTWVNAQYVSDMVAALVPGQDFVSTPQIDFGLNTFFSGLKWGNNADCATLLNLAYLTKLDSLAFGHSMGFYTHVFQKCVDWDYLNQTLCDDQALSRLFVRQGYRVVWQRIKCPVSFANKTWATFLDQQRRHAQCQKAPLGKTYLLSILGYPFWPLFFYAVMAPSAVGVGLLIGYWAFRVFAAGYQEKTILGTFRETLRWGWVLPVWEFFKPALVIYTVFSNTVLYHGVPYTIKNGFFLKRKRLQCDLN